MDESAKFKIEEKDKRGWVSIALVWTGSMICVSSLMVGSILGTGMSLPMVFLSILIGYGIVCAYMILIGMQSCQVGLPTALMAESALGKLGARYIISAILALSCIGWFGVQASVCGASFSAMFAEITGLQVPVWISTVVWGVIMLVTACFKFAGLKWLNTIAMPLLAIVLVYTLIDTLMGGGTATLAGYTPSAPMTFLAGISTVVGSFAVAGAIAGDFCRFAKDDATVIKSSIWGVMPSGILMLMLGAILAICTGTYDITVVLSSTGLPVIGLIALILATWTTNVANAYSGGLSLAIMLGQNEEQSRVTTAVAGLVGTVLAAVGIMNAFQWFLGLLSAFVPAVAGVLIADYWICNKGNAKTFGSRPGFNLPGVIAYAAGALTACITGGTFASIPLLSFLNLPFFIGPINGIVVSIVLYVVLMKVMPTSEPEVATA